MLFGATGGKRDVRAVPPNQWVELTEMVSFDGPVVVEHRHPSLRTVDTCRFGVIDYDPFEDVLEIQIGLDGGEIRLLIDDPQEIRFTPGEGLEIESLDQTVGIHPVSQREHAAVAAPSGSETG
jgi:hypothetical protein